MKGIQGGFQMLLIFSFLKLDIKICKYQTTFYLLDVCLISYGLERCGQVNSDQHRHIPHLYGKRMVGNDE